MYTTRNESSVNEIDNDLYLFQFLFPCHRKTSLSFESISKAAIIGIGIDTIHVPRLMSLLRRQARRVVNTTKKSTLAAARMTASQQLSRRILHEKELIEWNSTVANSTDDKNDDVTREQVNWLATR